MAAWSDEADVAIGSYRRYLAGMGHPAGTIEQYTTYPSRLFRDTRQSPWTVTGDLICDWLADHHQWKANTRRRAVGSLRGFYAWAAASGRCADNPTGILKPVRGKRGIPRPLPDQVLAVAIAQADHRDAMILKLDASTGLRRAELAAVRRSHVELHRGGWWLRVEGKGRKERLLPVSDEVAEWLRQLPTEHLFPTDDDTRHIQPPAVGKQVRRMLGGKWTTHTLRHRFATRAYDLSKDLEAVSKLLGHESVATTQIYIDVAREQLRLIGDDVWLDLTGLEVAS